MKFAIFLAMAAEQFQPNCAEDGSLEECLVQPDEFDEHEESLLAVMGHRGNRKRKGRKNTVWISTKKN